MKPELINAIRDLAVQHESKDTLGALELMSLALKHRPNGPFIKSKVEKYKKEIKNNNQDSSRLKEMLGKGEIAIIPIGFRCFTAMEIKSKLGVTQPSLPFNSGFFSPHSVARILNEQKFDLKFYDNGTTHTVCVKTEKNIDPTYGLGIKFETKGYDYINNAVKSKYQADINNYLDSIFGYYTLDKKYNYVLAHYNWHTFSDDKKSQGITDPEINLRKISEILNNRISRMMDLCHKANHIFFIFHEDQEYKYIQIDDKYYFLDDLSEIAKSCDQLFRDKYTLVKLSDVDSAGQLLHVGNL